VEQSNEAMSTMRTLSAPGLILEPQCAGHADEMFAVLHDSALFTYLDEAPPTSAAALRERFARLESRRSADGREQWLNWAIRLESAELAGFVQASVCEGGLAWIAFVIGREFWGHGVAQQAARAVLKEGSQRYAVTHWLATADQRNLRSIRLLRRLGFTQAPRALRAEHEVAATDVLMRLTPLARTEPAHCDRHPGESRDPSAQMPRRRT
jgi:[ribosomal protein S5]-alanine N-acetyltransferase